MIPLTFKNSQNHSDADKTQNSGYLWGQYCLGWGMRVLLGDTNKPSSCKFGWQLHGHIHL